MRYGSFLKKLTLPEKHTPCRVFRNARQNLGPIYSYSSLSAVSFVDHLPFQALTDYNRLNSGSFHLLFRDAFQLSFTVLYAIGLETYLGLEVDDPHILRAMPSPHTLEPVQFSPVFNYGTITLLGRPFQVTSLQL